MTKVHALKPMKGNDVMRTPVVDQELAALAIIMKVHLERCGPFSFINI